MEVQRHRFREKFFLFLKRKMSNLIKCKIKLNYIVQSVHLLVSERECYLSFCEPIGYTELAPALYPVSFGL